MMSISPKKLKAQKKVAIKRKAANGYKLPEPIPPGEIITDLVKRKWKLGPSVGLGGFGEIYAACDASSDTSQYPYVVKIEPHDNGPLFVEMHFYMKVAKADDIAEWMKKKKLKSLGIPAYIASGSHTYSNKKYRFLVLERYGQDLWTLFLQNKRRFPLVTVVKIGIQILYALEYIHSKSYVHGDVKGSNILLGNKKGVENQVFLIDFGLATRFSTKEYKEDPKRAHNGTIEYTSRDAHVGVPTRRGDLEILGYNMLQWLSSELPWEKKISQSPDIVHKEKIKYMNDITSLMKCCFKNDPYPTVLYEYFAYVASILPNEEPDYSYCYKLFKNELKKSGLKQDMKLQFSSSHKTRKTTRNMKRNLTVISSSDEDEGSPKKISASFNNKKQDQSKAKDEQLPEEMDFSFENSEPEETSSSKLKTQLKDIKKSAKKTVSKEVSPNKDNQVNHTSSWKQCPTILSSNVFRAGEYKKTSVKKPGKA